MIKEKGKKHIVVLAAQDKRKRYRFILDPLLLIKDVKVTFITEKTVYKTISRFLALRKKNPCDLIIFAHIDIFLALLLPLFSFLKIKCIIRFGGDLKEDFANRLAIARIRRQPIHLVGHTIKFMAMIILINFADGYIVVSSYLRWKIKKYILKDKSKIFIIPQYIKSCGGTYTRSFPKDLIQPRLKLLTVSNLNNEVKSNCLKTIIKYLMELKEYNTYIESYKIAGGGVYLDYLDKVIEKERRNDIEIQLMGNQNKRGLKKLYQESDILVYASLNDYLPNVLLEAQCFGMAIITNRYKPICDMLDENANAVFYDLNSKNEFSAGIMKLLRDKELINELGRNNYYDVKTKYSVESISGRLNVMLKRLLSENY